MINKKILFVFSLSQELNIVKAQIKKLSIRNLSFHFFSSGIWSYKIILNLSELVCTNKFDFIVNIWVCWYTKEKKDLIQVARIKNLSNRKELLVPIFINFASLESIASSENIIFNEDLLLGEKYVDMESYGIELLSNKYHIPRLILKIPIDKVWYETKSFDYKASYNYLERNIDYLDLLNKISSYLSKLEISDDLSEYFDYYKMTFSEKIIFQKLYNKYISYNWDTFSSFFINYKDLGKKYLFNFLEKL